MTRRQSLLVQGILFALSAVYAVWMLSQMPDRVPVHWGISGRPDRWGSKWELALLLPLFASLNLIPTWFLTKMMGDRATDASAMRSMYRILVVVAALFVVLHAIILQAALHQVGDRPADIGRNVFAVLFGFFALLGNFMGTVRRNPYVGIRVPWTMRDDRVWEETHRRAAHLWFLGGIAACLATLAGLPMPWSVVAMLAMVFWPVLDSYLIYRRRMG